MKKRSLSVTLFTITLAFAFTTTAVAAPIGTIMRIADAGKKMAMLAQTEALTLATKLQGLRAYAIKPAEVAQKLKSMQLGDKISAEVLSNKHLVEELRTALSPDHPFLAGLQSLGPEKKAELMAAINGNPELGKLATLDPKALFEKLKMDVALPDLRLEKPMVLDDTLVDIELKNLQIDEKLRRRILGNKHLTKKLRTALADKGNLAANLPHLSLEQREQFFKRALKDGGLHKLMNADPAKAFKRAKLKIDEVKMAQSHLNETLDNLNVKARVRRLVLQNEQLCVQLEQGLAKGQTFRRQFDSIKESHRALFLERAAKNKKVAPFITTNPEQAFRHAKVRLTREMRKLPKPTDDFLARVDLKDRMKNRLKNKHELVAQLQLAMVPGHPFLYYFGSLEQRLRNRFLDRAIKNKRILPLITEEPVKALRMGNISIR